MHDEVESRERQYLDASEPTWALWEVMRTAVDANRVIARRMGVSYNDARALDLLSYAEAGLGTVELGNLLGIRSASAAELVDRLEASGHVQRRPHPHDRRRVLVELTDHGREEGLAAIAPLLAHYDQIAADLGEHAPAVTGYLRAVAAAQRAFCAKDRPT